MDVRQAVTQASSSQRNAAASGENRGKQLGKQDFLNLMMTQLAHQDPMDPMKSENMMQQMSQLGTVEQLQNLNSKVENLLTSQKDLVLSNAYSFLGKDVELGNASIQVNGNSVLPANYSLEGDADSVSIRIMDSGNNMVRSISEKAQGKGIHEFHWDGLDSEGDRVPSGSYRYEVVASTGSGESIGVSQFQRGRVAKISFENGRPMVEINGEALPLDRIKLLSNDSERRFDNANPMGIRTDIPVRGTSEIKTARLSPKDEIQGVHEQTPEN